MNLKRILSWQHHRVSGMVRLQGGWSYQPFMVSFTLTGACNLRCAMCSTRSTSGIHLDADLVSRTLDDLARRWWWRKPVVHFIGGEPMVHVAFAELVRQACRQGFATSITTNGYFLPRYAKDLAAWGVNHITVSVDGPEGLHDHIRGVTGSYQAAREGVSRVLQARKKTPSIALNCTISPDNQARLQETVTDLAAWGADSLTLQHLVFDRSTIDLARAMNPEEIGRQLQSIRGRSFGMRLNVFPPIREGDINPYYRDLDYPFGTLCVVPWVVARVYPGAEVAPCLDLYMGTLREQPLPQIWNSPRWRKFRAARRRGSMLPGCLRCCHRQYYG
ncbi:radical SAM protein [Candidatus Fermentibacteria bacterium]|nr:radical SAM protein [Candidatus Fermentibacteria bacterium]